MRRKDQVNDLAAENISLSASPRFPKLPANLGAHTCCLYAFAPIPSTEWNSDIPFLIASIAAPSHRTKSAYWGCLHRACPNSDYSCLATCAPQKHSKRTRDVYKQTKVTLGMFDEGMSQNLKALRISAQKPRAPSTHLSRDARRTALPQKALTSIRLG